MLAELPLEELTGPLWVISGASDPFAPKDQLSEQLSRAARSQFELIPGVDHFFSAGGLAEVGAFARSAGQACAKSG